jgi:hypothetical protein
VKHTRLFLLVFLFPVLAAGQTPTLVQHVSCPNSGPLGDGIGGPQSSTPTYKCPLPELTQSGSALLLGFFANNSGGPTWTVSDDKGNTWTKATSTVDGSGNIVAVYYALNVAAGTHVLSVKSSAQTNGFVAVSASEYYNVATSSALDTSNCNAGPSSTTISAGSITPSTSGDLLWQWAAQPNIPANSTNVGAVTSFSAGTIPASSWLLNGTDIFDGDAVQAAVYNSTAAITPQFTSGTAQPFDSCVMALKAASAGNPPTNSFRIVHMLHQALHPGAPQTFPLQFPTSGNLLIASFMAGSNQITGISSTPSNTWTATGSPTIQGSDVFSQIYYVANASKANSMTISVSRSATGDATIIFYDVTGAALSPLVNNQGEVGSQPTIVGSITTCSACITPTTVTGGNELIVGNTGQSWGTVVAVSGPSGALLDTATFDGNSVNGPEDVDQNNGWFHAYTTSTSPVSVTFTYNTDGTHAQGDWANTQAVFKPSSSVTQQPSPPTLLKAIVN